MQIELPSGLVGDARKIRGSEAIELAERAQAPGGNSLGSILKGCWSNTSDAGPYVHAVPGEPGLDWDRVLKGDLLAGLIKLRAASIPDGKRYEFHVQCERCRKRYGWVVNDITKDLPYRKLSKESAERVRAGLPFEAEVMDPDGPAPLRSGASIGKTVHKLTFDLMLPSQDADMRLMLKQLERKKVTNVESLAAQTRTIDGEKRSPIAMQRFFRDLDLGELNRLRDLYDAADCGVDIDIMTTCQEIDCGWEQETTLPFGRTFWRPEVKKPLPKEEDEEETPKKTVDE